MALSYFKQSAVAGYPNRCGLEGDEFFYLSAMKWVNNLFSADQYLMNNYFDCYDAIKQFLTIQRKNS